ncbi:unnamed protein product [Symbiodinium sp. CCMP2456]|nr:unnamed protein product [Symbiodinium sp. CCMP2456]
MLFTRLLVAISSLHLSFGPRSSDLDFLEVFAGEHVLFSAAKLYGLRAHGIDVTYSRKLDLLTAFGFLFCLHSSFLKLDISRGYTDAQGRNKRVGGRDLTASGVYPGMMALKVAELLQNHLANAPTSYAVDEMDMELCDTVDDESDSGLEDLVGADRITSAGQSS